MSRSHRRPPVRFPPPSLRVLSFPELPPFRPAFCLPPPVGLHNLYNRLHTAGSLRFPRKQKYAAPRGRGNTGHAIPQSRFPHSCPGSLPGSQGSAYPDRSSARLKSVHSAPPSARAADLICAAHRRKAFRSDCTAALPGTKNAQACSMPRPDRRSSAHTPPCSGYNQSLFPPDPCRRFPLRGSSRSPAYSSQS